MTAKLKSRCPVCPEKKKKVHFVKGYLARASGPCTVIRAQRLVQLPSQ